ncbi:methyl-accepting chemotaxis protein [Bradyrhizobium sp. WSM2793]|uniref:methyl-accepting chemotaxis protein n=1 Tax=Bradyrhizobium sp. WSM2793 TaxID=1038866 RepID=UPI0003801EFE|nr:methyl-accepting chemotaxis protein [Bradyrhizobium sp. WSM2793]
MLSRYSIRSKLVVVISLLLLVFGGTGLLAISNMRLIQGGVAEFQSRWLPAVRLLGNLRAYTIRYGSVVRDHILESDSAKKASAEKLLADLTRDIEKEGVAYELLLSSPEERKLYTDFQQLWSAYVAQVPDVLSASRRNDIATASDLIVHQMQPLRQDSGQALLKAMDINNKRAAAAGQSAEQTYAFAFALIVGTLVLTLVLSSIVGLLLLRDISMGIRSIIAPMRALANGDVTVAVHSRAKHTEIGQMAAALQVFKESLIAKQAADKLAAAEAEAKILRGQRIDKITGGFRSMIGELVAALSTSSGELEAAAETLSKTADTALHISATVAAASEEASLNVQTVASATEEMTSSVSEIGRQVEASTKVASEAVRQAAETNHRINKLSTAATRIGDVVSLITTIAGQTNLLALNATIEAARAGESGRGFAVVASEVKALAGQTARATSEISEQISEIQIATQESADAIKHISTTIDRISAITAAIAAAVEEQANTTGEISRSLQHAARGTVQVASNITEVKQGAVEAGSASSQVLSSAQSLTRERSRLEHEVQRFLAAIQAA